MCLYCKFKKVAVFNPFYKIGINGKKYLSSFFLNFF